MSDDEKPCGEYHPLPCGLDKECRFLEDYVHKDELRELVESWREDAQNPDLNPMARHAIWGKVKEIEELIQDE